MYRFARVGRLSLIVLALLSGAARSASAQSSLFAGEPPADATVLDATRPASDRLGTEQSARPKMLVPLYVSFASLQVLDAHTTARALDRGAVEANPIMRGFTGSTAGMLAIKTAGTAGVVWASERMWRRNKTAAVIFLVAANSAMGWVVQHNYRAAR
jgi:hypothetical protein